MTTGRLCTDDEVLTFLAGHLQWERDGESLVRTGRAGSFPAAIAWVRAVADVAELMDHHPDMDIRWCTVTFRLCSHDLGGITPRDLELALHIDSIIAA
jgi:4a-hydroxytetrahydrobiopterin dehydratase